MGCIRVGEKSLRESKECVKYNSDIHHRRSIRLKGYDYSKLGAYFITICTFNRELYFEKYTKLKEIVNQQWQKITKRYSNLILDEFIIMPNHIHGIIIVGATLAVAQNRAGARPAPTIGKIIGTFKSLCVHDWLIYLKKNEIAAVGKFWQRNYYEHIIRGENDLNKIRQYIQNNPLKWYLDRENQERKGTDSLEEEIFERFKNPGEIPKQTSG